jgi:hypothetical protein
MLSIIPKCALELELKTKTSDVSSDWDYLEDGYFTREERAELDDIVRNEKLEMIREYDKDPAASLGLDAFDLTQIVKIF